ncbi:alpha/beta hydrolase [Actinoplanes sp. NPDC051494]|uniref:alpha/beta hydrolase n=1 Tax=Actinoplanes sp. NPDC051494 TaxID=3363907 RepID=UPI00378C0641
MKDLGKRLLTAGIAGVLAVAPVAICASAAVGAPSGGPSGATAGARTGAVERQRVDAVRTPRIGWYECYGNAECATTELPLDYDEPRGATTEIALLRIKAKDQKNRIGSLFVNPGGPGGSGTSFAYSAQYFLSPAVLQRFDIVGFDPRGIGASENVRCFPSVRAQNAVLRDLNIAFPWGRAEEKKYIRAAEELGRACSSTGEPLTGSASTAEAARDMDVLRRAVGDDKLSYLGFSYGTAIGQYYANMFPDRFRTVAVDGVLDPEHWAGTGSTAGQGQDQRVRSAAGAHRALMEILGRCDEAGPKYCVFAAGDPKKRFEVIARKLRAEPIEITDEFGTYTISYADFVGGMLGALYGVDAGDFTTYLAQEVWTLLFPPSAAAAGTAKAALIRRIKQARTRPGRDFPYDNSLESASAVACADAQHPRDADLFPALTAAADKKAPYFGRAWGWATVQCSRSTWTARDEDAYTGPWTTRTAAPVLLVGTRWDPATSYEDAVSAAGRLPNSFLLSSTNWGHTSYGTSACATGAIDTYLLSGALPARGTLCKGDYEPFTAPLPVGGSSSGAESPREAGLPPVADPLPLSILNGNR